MSPYPPFKVSWRDGVERLGKKRAGVQGPTFHVKEGGFRANK
jgi:hypothetical protein